MAWGLCTLTMVCLALWAGRTVFSPPQTDQEKIENISTVTVVEDTIGQSVTVSGSAEYQVSGRGLAGTNGTLTSITRLEDGVIREGDVLVTIDLEPVVVAEGEVPMFRDLQIGTSGEDVSQLRLLLGLEGSQEFDSETESAVRAWQKRVGLSETGTVLKDHLIFVASLPAPAVVAPDLQVGDQIEPGRVLIEAFTPSPDVYVLSQTSQAALRPGLAVRFEDGAVGELEAAAPDEQGLTRFAVVGPDGEPACTGSCPMELPAPGPSPVEVVIEVVPPATGPTLPRAAIRFAPNGNALVQRNSGQEVQVSIVREAEGKVVIEGLEVGDVVRLFPEET